MDLKTFRHIIRRIHRWEGTPDFRNKLVYNTKAVFSLFPYTKSQEEYNELIHRYKVMIDYLDTVRPRSMQELAKYMRSNDLKNVDLYKP